LLASTSLLVVDCFKEHEYVVQSVRANESGRYRVSIYHKFLTKVTDFDKAVLRSLLGVNL
jgi:hypothetical protein